MSDKMEDDQLPPPYTPTASHHGLLAQLGAIRARVQSSSEQADSLHVSSALVSISALVDSVAALQPPLPRAVEAVLVPEAALAPGWVPSDPGDGADLTRIVRVHTGEERERNEARVDESGAHPDVVAPHLGGPLLDGWGRWDDAGDGAGGAGDLWWADGDMARRIVSSLEQKMSDELESRAGGVKEEAAASLSFRADEVTFRRESEMGLWESTSGWAVVVHVSITSR